MARARNIKPSIMDNEDLAELEPLTRLLFIYLWMLADREGRLEDRPKRIAAQALAYDRQADVNAMLDSLHAGGFILRYKANGLDLIQIVAFEKHQNPHIREAASELPPPKQGTTKARAKHNLGSAQEQPTPERAGLIPDSGFLIPDSLIPESGDARIRALPAKLLADYLKVRKAKRAGEFTTTAIDGMEREAAKAGLSLEDAMRYCCEAGWQGFNANWYAERQAKAKTTGETAYQRSMRERMEQFAPSIAAKPPGPAKPILEVFDVSARALD